MESEQNVLTAAFYRLSGDPGDVDRDRMIGDLDQTDREIARMVSQGSNGPNADALGKLQRAVQDFSQEAHQYFWMALCPLPRLAICFSSTKR